MKMCRLASKVHRTRKLPDWILARSPAIITSSMHSGYALSHSCVQGCITHPFLMLRPTLLRFLIWLIWCYDGPCSMRVVEGAAMPRACTARPKGVHNSLIHARLQQEQPKIALEICFRHRQRLTLSWFSSSRVRNTGLQIKIYFDDFLFMLELALQH
ncbi:hypothetical protein EDD22DRAFT_78571 [Suillus occidentalis]|nr:hypothetical protein EDD22DRAFT_78571 [Suillus occidentalis]